MKHMAFVLFAVLIIGFPAVSGAAPSGSVFPKQPSAVPPSSPCVVVCERVYAEGVKKDAMLGDEALTVTSHPSGSSETDDRIVCATLGADGPLSNPRQETCNQMAIEYAKADKCRKAVYYTVGQTWRRWCS
jgi:hypothetical protein